MTERNDSRLEIRLPEKELEQIRKNAEACDKTVSAYVRETALNMCVITPPAEEITKHTNEISAYRNTINQLIFTIKQTGYYNPLDIEYILDKINLLLESEKELLNTYSKSNESFRKQIARIVRYNISKNINK